MKNIILLLFIGLVIFSCKKEEPEPGCLELALDLLGNTNCQNAQIPDGACEVQAIGEFQLTEKSISFIPSFCEENFNLINFINMDGELLRFSVLTKTFVRNGTYSDSGIPCTADSSERIAYCIVHEEMSLRMRSSDANHDFNIVVTTKPQINGQTGDNAGDFLDITVLLPDRSFHTPFSAIIDQRSLTVAETTSQKFESSRTIINRTFQNVFSNDSNITPTNYRFFYTQTEGLVGFVDRDKVLWELME